MTPTAELAQFEDALIDAYGELDAARIQIVPSDDRIIADHIVSVCGKLKAIIAIVRAQTSAS